MSRVGDRDQDAAEQHRGDERQDGDDQVAGGRAARRTPVRLAASSSVGASVGTACGTAARVGGLLAHGADTSVSGVLGRRPLGRPAPASPAISRPISSAGSCPAGTSPMILPRYMTPIRSASPSTSSSSVETSDHGGAAVALGDDPLVHELDRADVEAARRLGHDQQLQRAGQLAGEHDLLLVAAGQGRRGVLDATTCGRRTPRPARSALLPDRGRGRATMPLANGARS